MAKTQTIKCINKNDRDDPYTRIKYVGGTNPDGSRWKISQETAIQRTESGEWVFYVDRGANRVKVVVATSPHGNKYIKTEADDQEPNNLLSLPECP